MTSSTFPKLDASDGMLCIARKIKICERVISNTYRNFFAPYKLTISQFTILMVAFRMPELKQVDLAKILIMEKSSVNRNLKRLFDQKLIKLANSKQITLTNKGKQLLENIIPEWEKAQKEILNKLQNKGLQSLNILFNNLTSKTSS